MLQALESALLSGDVALGQTDPLTGSVRGELGEKAPGKMFFPLSNIRFWRGDKVTEGRRKEGTRDRDIVTANTLKDNNRNFRPV